MFSLHYWIQIDVSSCVALTGRRAAESPVTITANKVPNEQLRSESHRIVLTVLTLWQVSVLSLKQSINTDQRDGKFSPH